MKPHGALYNLAAADEHIASVIIEVMKRFGLNLKLYVPYKSVIAKLAIQNKIPIVYEVFADRNYNDDLTLVSRQEKDALIDDENELFEHVFRMISKGKVKTIQGHEIGIKANTFCIHGDHPKVVILIKNLKEKLELHGIKIR